ncbi:hypothetical protein ACFC08_28280 [Streptomyces sp. NPDC056112]|uniref:hypothetical protein n=1 Tax=Streptomyces sp. NPDC056112 TaxID=3345715 RepID=UPI0035E0D2F8
MAKLAKAVFVKGVLLEPGEEPEPRLAALITNPDAWEDGKPPAATKKTASSDEDGGDKPARGRDAAEEGNSGD